MAPPGTYIPTSGATAAITDPAGTYSGAGASAPTTDPAGTYSGAGASAPTTDPAGTYSGAGASAPTLAPPGTYIPTSGATAAITDPAGTYSGAGASAPTSDPAGTYSGAGASAPTTDPAGTYSGAGASAPTLAPPGTYIPTSGATAAITDPAGTYSGAGASAPTTDPAGTYSGTGASAPTTDPAGTYSGAGASAPTLAPAGTYIPTSGATAAITDPAGTYSGTGASAPTTDPVGSYSAAGANAPIFVDGFTSGGPFDLTAVPFDASAPQPVLINNGIQQNLLQITENGVTYGLQLDPNLNYSDTTFAAFRDLSGTGTEITESTMPCYCRGTLIRTDCGEKRVEELAIGDVVVTASGPLRPIKWIGRRSYTGRFVMGRKDILPVCIKAGALADDVPRRDLWISPHHAMYFAEKYPAEGDDGGLLIEAKDLINSVSIVQAESVEQVEYFHVELETHDVIIAEGALSETFIDDDSGGMFHNAHEDRRLDAEEHAAPAQYCAPRVDEGYGLETIRRRIALRAGLTTTKEATPGPLRGFVDRITPHVIEGWAQNIDHPEAPVCLDIFVGGRLIGQVIANRYRQDLKQTGIGSGRHSFEFTPPDGLAYTSNTVAVRRSLDEAVLPMSEQAKSVGVSTAA